MTKEPSEAAKIKACELANAAANYNLYTADASGGNAGIRALALHLDEVNKELRACFGAGIDAVAKGPLGRFVLPDPPDLLEEALRAADVDPRGPGYQGFGGPHTARVRAELDKRGFAIVPKG